MVVPVDREGKLEDSTLLRREPPTSASLEPLSTRKAGGRPQNQGSQTVSYQNTAAKFINLAVRDATAKLKSGNISLLHMYAYVHMMIPYRTLPQNFYFCRSGPNLKEHHYFGRVIR